MLDEKLVGEREVVAPEEALVGRQRRRVRRRQHTVPFLQAHQTFDNRSVFFIDHHEFMINRQSSCLGMRPRQRVRSYSYVLVARSGDYTSSVLYKCVHWSDRLMMIDESTMSPKNKRAVQRRMRACLVDARALLLRVGAPEEEDERLARAPQERLDRRVRELLPAALAVRVGLVRAHRQHRVQQQHTYRREGRGQSDRGEHKREIRKLRALQVQFSI